MKKLASLLTVNEFVPTHGFSNTVTIFIRGETVILSQGFAVTIN